MSPAASFVVTGAWFAVSDPAMMAGEGIPEEIRDKLFQPNFTTKSGGMGMGLAITYNIVRSMGGEIWYDTVLHKGTTFHVELPESFEKR